LQFQTKHGITLRYLGNCSTGDVMSLA